MKRIAIKIIFGIFFLTLLIQPASAANVLLHVDSIIGVDYVTPALAAGGHTVTTATSWSDFDTRLAGGGYDLAIALVQNVNLYPDLTTLSNYIAGGGKVIFADWTQTASYGTLFKASYTGVNDVTPTNLTEPALVAGITNPVALINPGWGIWSMGLSPQAGGTSLGTFPNGDSSIVASNENRTVILGFLSDTLPAADGQQFWENLIKFVIPSAAVPAVSTLGMIIFSILLVISAAFVMRGRQQA